MSQRIALRDRELLMLGFGFFPASAWTPVAERLSSRLCSRPIDLRVPEHGEKSPVGAGLERLCAQLDEARVARVDLVAGSLSSIVAREFALAHPERCASLTLVGPLYGGYGEERTLHLLESWIRVGRDLGPGALFDVLYPLTFSSRAIECGGALAYVAQRERFLQLNAPDSIERELRALAQLSHRPERLRGIRCPVLLVRGADDSICSSGDLAGASALIAGARVATVPLVGHAVHVEAPDALARALAGFLGADGKEDAPEREPAATELGKF